MTIWSPEGQRIEPNMSASDYKTYQIIKPKATHFRPSSCKEVNCSAYQNGWKSLIDESTELGQKQAHYIRYECGRSFTTERLPSGITEFVFSAGQNCFQQHQVSLDKPEIYVVRDGDFRGNPRGTEAKIHANGADWVDDFANHQDKVKTLLERG